MGLFRRGAGVAGGAGALNAGGPALNIPTLLVWFLVLYFVGNVGMHIFRAHKEHVNGVPALSTSRTGELTQEEKHSLGDVGRELIQEEKYKQIKQKLQKNCDSIEAYMEDGSTENTTENPWRQMKWGLPPARCRVKGHLIERLDPTYNYRRGVALRFTDDLDDKTHIEHWFLGTKVNLNKRKRRVFIDLGANYFHTSLLWFQQRYPCDFTEVYAFETDSHMLQIPVGFDEETNWVDPNEPGWKKIKGRDGYIPQWMAKRIRAYNKYAGDVDDEANNAVNITRFIKEELKLTKADAVVVKMDIEGSEWPILERWVNDPEMPMIIDELWVELHYYHPDNDWLEVKDYSRERATRMLAALRYKGFYAHYWD